MRPWDNGGNLRNVTSRCSEHWSRVVNEILFRTIPYFNPTMLSASHDRAYQDFLTLLTKFGQVVGNAEQKIDKELIIKEFQDLSVWFKLHIVALDDRELELAIASRWLSVQTEIQRAFKLLSTDILFLASAGQDSTLQKRLKSINDRLSKLIGYCQIMLSKDNN